MRAGGYKWYKLKTYMPTSTVSEFGGERISYTEVSEVYGWQQEIRGTYKNEADEMFSDYDVRWHIKIGASNNIREGWRLQQLGGCLYLVTNVIQDRSNNSNIFVCEKVNE